jgi:prepilin-type N-terminal cleavage/methylation domain-containing protein
MIKKQNGFTIIELTIVILALSVLSLFLIFPIEMNLIKARDTVRKSNITMIANIIKLNGISENNGKYDIPKDKIRQIIQKNTTSFPSVVSDKHYFYGHSNKGEDFFVIICSEKNEEFFIKGTVNGEKAVSFSFPWKTCENNSIPVAERFVPLNKKAPTTSLNSYVIYKII